MDVIYYKITDERSSSVTHAVCNVLGIDMEEHKELLGMYISRDEGANFWLSVQTDLQEPWSQRYSYNLYRRIEIFS